MRNEQKGSRKKSSCIVITYQTFWCVVYLSIFTAQLVKILSDTKTKTTNKIYVCMSGEEVLAKPFLSLINKKQPHHLTFFERICQLASIVFKVCVYRIWCFCKNFCPFFIQILSDLSIVSVYYQVFLFVLLLFWQRLGLTEYISIFFFFSLKHMLLLLAPSEQLSKQSEEALKV